MASVYQIEFGECIFLINRSFSTFFVVVINQATITSCHFHTKLRRICCMMVLCSNAMAACHSWQHRTFTYNDSGSEMSKRRNFDKLQPTAVLLPAKLVDALKISLSLAPDQNFQQLAKLIFPYFANAKIRIPDHSNISPHNIAHVWFGQQ